MSDAFVGEVRVFPFNFAPRGWAFCNGQLLPISQNTALFSLLGTFYGGDGKSTFALPDMQGNVAIGQGQGPGLSDYFLGQQSGVADVTLIITEIPLHTHGLMADQDAGPDNVAPANAALSTNANTAMYSDATSPLAQFAFQALPPAGGSLPHNNMAPFLTLNFCIAMQGIFPQRP